MSILRIGVPVIINDCDAPEARMVAVLCRFDARIGLWHARYLSTYTLNGKCSGYRPTPLCDFGVALDVQGAGYRCRRTGSSRATYPDGMPRDWQDRSGREWWTLRSGVMDLVAALRSEVPA